MIELSRSKIYLAISLLFAVVLIGVLGYRFIADYTWVDALYMTVITMATVGFKEVQPLDDTAKIFTVFLIFMKYKKHGLILSKKMKIKKSEKVL